MFTGALAQGDFRAINIQFTVMETLSHSNEGEGSVSLRVFGRLLNYMGPPNPGKSFTLTCREGVVRGAFIADGGSFEAVAWEATT